MLTATSLRASIDYYNALVEAQSICAAEISPLPPTKKQKLADKTADAKSEVFRRLKQEVQEA
jgi:hypothetical protein